METIFAIILMIVVLVSITFLVLNMRSAHCDYSDDRQNEYMNQSVGRMVQVQVFTRDDQSPGKHVVFLDDLDGFIQAQTRLHLYPGINPHNKGRTSPLRSIKIKTLVEDSRFGEGVYRFGNLVESIDRMSLNERIIDNFLRKKVTEFVSAGVVLKEGGKKGWPLRKLIVHKDRFKDQDEFEVGKFLVYNLGEISYVSTGYWWAKPNLGASGFESEKAAGIVSL